MRGKREMRGVRDRNQFQRALTHLHRSFSPHGGDPHGGQARLRIRPRSLSRHPESRRSRTSSRPLHLPSEGGQQRVAHGVSPRRSRTSSCPSTTAFRMEAATSRSLRLSHDGHAHLRVRLLLPSEGGSTESPNCVSLTTVTRIFVSVYSCLLKGAAPSRPTASPSRQSRASSCPSAHAS